MTILSYCERERSWISNIGGGSGVRLAEIAVIEAAKNFHCQFCSNAGKATDGVYRFTENCHQCESLREALATLEKEIGK